MRAMELASEDGDSAVKHELELLLAAASRPPLADPQVRSRGSRRISFASVLEESSEEGNEEALDERVRVWLDETLTSPSSAIQESARSGAAPDARRQRARSKELASPTSLWVLPEAMAMTLSGELFDEPLTISDSARADAMACLDTWDYDTLALQEASDGHALLLVGEALFEWHKLHEPCHVDRVVLHHFLRALEACYGDHEYHNAMHGADVALGVHHFIVKFGVTARLTKLELLAALVGALVHDFNHPGTNNGHEVRARTERARTHTDAILERHHLHSTFTLLATPAFDLFGKMPADDRKLCRNLIVEMVLATDMKKHRDIIYTLRALAAQHGAVAAEAPRGASEGSSSASNGDSPESSLSRQARRSPPSSSSASRLNSSHEGEQGGGRLHAERAEWASPFQAQAHVDVPLLLAVAIKFADLGHCFKPFQLHKQWAERITDEFWALGDRERQLGIAVSPLCDRDKDSNVPESQVGFFKHICVPFYSIVADLIDPTMLPWLRVQENLHSWELENSALKDKLRATQQQQQEASSARTVLIDALRARPPPAAPAAHDAGIDYGVLAADIAADNMAAHIAIN